MMRGGVKQLTYKCLSNASNTLYTHSVSHTQYLVVEACAMMFPPIGFLGSVANMEAPSTWATTWLVITTATPNYSSQERPPFMLANTHTPMRPTSHNW